MKFEILQITLKYFTFIVHGNIRGQHAEVSSLCLQCGQMFRGWNLGCQVWQQVLFSHGALCWLGFVSLKHGRVILEEGIAVFCGLD